MKYVRGSICWRSIDPSSSARDAMFLCWHSLQKAGARGFGIIFLVLGFWDRDSVFICGAVGTFQLFGDDDADRTPSRRLLLSAPSCFSLLLSHV